MRLLITGAWGGAKEHIAEIEEMGHETVFQQNESDSLPCESTWVEGIIGNGIFLYHPIEQFTNLKWIQLTSAGYDRAPMDDIEKRGIAIDNARGVYSVPMAEFAIGGVLQLYKQSRFFAQNQSQRRWEKRRGLLELYGKTVLIVGCGSVGTECAKRFEAFGSDVVGVNPHPRDSLKTVLPLNRLNDVLTQADVIVLTLPLTESSRRLINRERLHCMKEGAILVNISRGAVVEEDGQSRRRKVWNLP